MEDIAHDAVFLEDGNILITGASYQTTENQMDAFTAKLNPSGEVIWQTCFGDQFEDGGNQIAITENGNYFIAGHTDRTGTDLCDAFCFYMNADGDTIWTRTFGFELDDAAYGCAIAHDNGFLAVGRAIVNGDPQGFLIKYNLEGDLLWQKFYGSAGEDHLNAIQPIETGGYFICGRSSQNDNGDFWLLKIDEEGNEIWSVTCGTNLIDIAYNLELANDGGVLLVGKSFDNATFSKIYLARLDADGNIKWTYTTGNHLADAAHGVKLNSEGNWDVSGTFFNTATFSEDAMLMEIDDSGNLNWMKYYGNDQNDSGQRLSINSSGQLLLSGSVSVNEQNDMLVVRTDAWGDVFSTVDNAFIQNVKIQAYPNPCSDNITFNFSELKGEMEFKIVDLTGKVIYQTQELHSELISINTADWASGLYFYELIDPLSPLNQLTGKLQVQN